LGERAACPGLRARIKVKKGERGMAGDKIEIEKRERQLI
jgi:hypothetical protein